MNKEEAIRFAGLMEDYLNIPSFVCEMIQQQLEENKYKEVIEYVIQRRNEIESKEDYISYQQAINMWIKKLEEKDKEITRLNNIIDELEKWLEESKKYGSLVYSEIKEDGSFEEFIKLEEIKNKLKELKEGK